jgi:ankyrin repeat protein
MRFLLALLCSMAAVPVAAQALAPPTPAERKLSEAAFEGKLEIVRQLVSEGVAVDAVDPDKRTALMWAAFNGHTAVVAHLLEHGAGLEAKDVNGRTALMYASSGPFPGTVELLLKK